LNSNGVQVFVTGTENEGRQFRPYFDWSDDLIDTSGRFTLSELISFINEVDVLLACSTGPLHIAGALGVPCIGLFSPRIPIHPGRWKPLGVNSEIVVGREACKCKKKEVCDCLQQIEVAEVVSRLKTILKI
jgi:ADP-heptose:LPS heptosyltransferase